MLPTPAKSRSICKDLKGNSSQFYLLNEHGDLHVYFLLQIYIVGNNQGKFKKKLCRLLFLGNHLNTSAIIKLMSRDKEGELVFCCWGSKG